MMVSYPIKRFTIVINIDLIAMIFYLARALIIDGRHFITFDKRFVTLDICSFNEIIKPQISNFDRQMYVLAHEFSQSNFTLLLETIKVNNGSI